MEVTDEMLALLREYQMGAYGELDDDCDKRMIAALIELHEQSKPNPEPVGFISFKHGGWLVKPHEAERMNNIDADFRPLYTTPPTREPYTGERVICAAVMLNDKLYCGYRHANIYNQCFGTYLNGIEGFITTDNGRFVDRKEAWLIADKAGQIINRGEGIDGLLFSENLY